MKWSEIFQPVKFLLIFQVFYLLVWEFILFRVNFELFWCHANVFQFLGKYRAHNLGKKEHKSVYTTDIWEKIQYIVDIKPLNFGFIFQTDEALSDNLVTIIEKERVNDWWKVFFVREILLDHLRFKWIEAIRVVLKQVSSDLDTDSFLIANISYFWVYWHRKLLLNWIFDIFHIN